MLVYMLRLFHICCNGTETYCVKTQSDIGNVINQIVKGSYPFNRTYSFLQPLQPRTTNKQKEKEKKKRPSFFLCYTLSKYRLY